MKPYYEDPRLTIYQGDALAVLRELPEESVHCCVTSPPYWGLRDYGVAGQIGLEKTPEEYVAKMVEVFREVRRVLREDGSCWVNLGDSYASGGRGGGMDGERGEKQRSNAGALLGPKRAPDGLKPKDLCGIPWRVALALQADGWVLRQEIIWNKPAPMPESVRDRCTKSHEQIFLFCKATWSGPDNGQFAHISDQNARWLAMFVDTEGNICIKRSERQDSGRMQYGAQVAFANTSRALLETAQRIVGIGSFHERKGKNSPMFYWQMAGQQARDFLHRIYPFLIVKQRQAALAIHVQDVLNTKGKKRPGGYRAPEHTEFLETAWARMKMLNHFGNPDLSDVPIPQYGRWSGCARYFFDQEAIKEPVTGDAHAGRSDGQLAPKWNNNDCNGFNNRAGTWQQTYLPSTRNKRSVWTVSSDPYSEAHFATFPTDLIKPCILAGTSAKGCCPQCGAPWERVVEKEPNPMGILGGEHQDPNRNGGLGKRKRDPQREARIGNITSLGWQPGCECGETKTQPCTVLDPFFGSGCTGNVALEFGRACIGIELNPKYIELAKARCNVTPGLPIA